MYDVLNNYVFSVQQGKNVSMPGMRWGGFDLASAGMRRHVRTLVGSNVSAQWLSRSNNTSERSNTTQQYKTKHFGICIILGVFLPLGSAQLDCNDEVPRKFLVALGEST